MFCFILRNTTPIFNGKGRTHSNSPPVYFRVKEKKTYTKYITLKEVLNFLSFGFYLIVIGHKIKFLCTFEYKNMILYMSEYFFFSYMKSYTEGILLTKEQNSLHFSV